MSPLTFGEIQALALGVDCPKCDAKTDTFCQRTSGNIAHLDRVKAAEAILQEVPA